MKVRKGFVTNSSSTNFGVMVVTSLAGISAASLISALEFDEKAKKKEYVKLVVEAPVRRVLRPGQGVTISAQIVKTEIVDGEISDTVSVVGGANISCKSGNEIVQIEPAVGEGAASSLTFTVIDDLKALLNYTKTISFSVVGFYDGETLRSNVWFTVPCFMVSPMNGSFVVDKRTEEIIRLESNFGSSYSYDFSEGNMLRSYTEDRGDFFEEIKLTEDVEDIKANFNMFTCKVFRDYKIDAPIESFKMSSNYRATFLRESILVSKALKQPAILKCFKDDESDKRTQEAYLLHIKVVKYDDKAKKLKTDINLTNKLEFSFTPVKQNKNLTFEQAQKAIEDAKITAELIPDKGSATDKQPYAIYRIYPDALVEAESDNVDLVINISCNDSDIEDIAIKGQLKPRINLKGLITQFIEYPVGTYIGSLIKLGNVDTYHNALDELSDIKLVGSGSPRFEPKTNSMILRAIPESIAEFKEVQTIHHELCHKIEEINGDSFLYGGAWGERHSYFIQYLSDVAKGLADIERGSVSNIKDALDESIHKLYLAYYNPDNLEHPPAIGEIKEWFGVSSYTPHEVFNRYLDFSIYCRNDSLADNIKDQIEKSTASQYFPGDIKGYWREVGGLFDGGEWVMMWQYGNVFKIVPKHKGYVFREISRRWLGDNRLAFEARYEVIRESDNDEDELIAIFDAGTFNPKSWVYPRIEKFSLKWKAGRTLSECILGDHMDKTVDVMRK